MKEFKIKSPTELFKMINKINKDDLESYRDVLDYVDKLESALCNYQMVLDQIKYSIDTHNVNVTR